LYNTLSNDSPSGPAVVIGATDGLYAILRKNFLVAEEKLRI
jgi:hypothetical protein